MKDFFAFRLMISAGLIKVVYPLGILAILALVGMSWFGGTPHELLSSYRSGVYPGGRDDDFGFRLVLLVGALP